MSALSTFRISSWLASRLSWALAGALALYAVVDTAPVRYPEVIVPAARIIEREVPGEIRWRDRIQYVYLQPDTRAVGTDGALADVQRFCRPIAVPDAPAPSVIRTVSFTPSLLPLRKGSLLVTSFDATGTLIAEDFSARAPFGIRAGLDPPYQTLVRYDRLSLPRELAHGFLWYLPLRALEAILR